MGASTDETLGAGRTGFAPTGAADGPQAQPDQARDNARWLRHYEVTGFRNVAGWVMPEALVLLAAIDSAQKMMRVNGGVMEVGIYQGKMFIALNAVVEDRMARSVAIDLFGEQVLNIDGSGTGSETLFRSNLRTYDRHQGANVVILQADSTTLSAADVLAQVDQRPRIVSIDGGHTPEHTVSDLRLSQSVMASRGIVLVDDILNAAWLGSIEGVMTFLNQRPTLWPLAVGASKLVMAPMPVHSQYRELLCRVGFVTFQRTTRFCGYEVLTSMQAKSLLLNEDAK